MRQYCRWAQRRRVCEREHARGGYLAHACKLTQAKVAPACGLSRVFLLPILNVVFVLSSKPSYDRKALLVQEENCTG